VIPLDDAALRFDPDWFRKSYPKSAQAADLPDGPTLFEVYLSQARALGVSPNEYFDEKHYRSIYKDVVGSIEDGTFWCGFDHYLRHGHAEYRQARRPDYRIAVDLRDFGGAGSDPFRDAFVVLWLRGMTHLIPQGNFMLVVDGPGVDAFAEVEGVNAKRLPMKDFQSEIVRILRKRAVDVMLCPYGSTDLTFPDYPSVLVADRPLDLTSRSSAERTRVLREWRRFDGVLCTTPAIAREVRETVGPEGIEVRPFPLAAFVRDGLSVTAPRSAGDASYRVMVAGLSDTATIGALVKRFCEVQAAGDGRAIEFVLLDAPDKVLNSFRGLASKRELRCEVTGALSSDVSGLLRLLGGTSLFVDLGGEWSNSLDVLAAAVCLPVLRPASGDLPGVEEIAHSLAPSPLPPAAGAEDARNALSIMEGARAAARDRTVLHGVSSADGSIEWLALRVAPGPQHRVLSIAIQTPHDIGDRRVRLERWLNGELQDRILVEPGIVLKLEVILPADGGVLDWRLVVMNEAGKWGLARVGTDRRMRCLHAFVRVDNQILLSGIGAAGDAVSEADASLDRANALIEAYEPLKREVSNEFFELTATQPAMRLKIQSPAFLTRIARPRVLHVVKPSYLDPGLLYHGSTKDILGRRNYFKSRGFEIDDLIVPPKEQREQQAIRTLMARRGIEYDIIFIEYLLYPELMEYFRDRYPNAKIMVRGHNAEILHRIDTMYAIWLTSGDLPLRERIKALRVRKQLRTIRRYLDDELRCARLADHVVSISDWETKHYWPRVVGAHKTTTVPYFVPSEIAREYPSIERSRRVVALSSVGPGPLVLHALQNFKRLVDVTADRLPGWTFAATGGFDAVDVLKHKHINFVGTVEDPIDELRGAAAMALLSPLGYGFKTKIMDAVTARAFTLLPKGLMKRVPEELRPYCILVDPADPKSFVRGAEQALADWPGGDPNGQLRRRAFRAMDEIVGIGELAVGDS